MTQLKGTKHQVSGYLTRHRVGLVALGVAVAVATVAVPPLVLSDPPTASGPPAASGEPRAVSGPPSAPLTITATPSPTPAALTVEAEAPGNLIIGGAQVAECNRCSGGGRVRYLGGPAELVVRTSLSAPATWITVVYEVEGDRELVIAINGVVVAQPRVVGATWQEPRTLRLALDLAPGPLSITFSNRESPAPDVDAVIIG